MSFKTIVFILVALTQIYCTPMDYIGDDEFNGEVRQKREITFEQCKTLQIEMITWRRDAIIAMTIIIAILLFFMVVLILYCCSKRDFFQNRE